MEVTTTYIAPAEPTLPALAVQIIRLVDSYMIWVGVTEESVETVTNAPRSGSLCKDWACAMPAADIPATALYRTSGSDVAMSMAQRLAKRTRKPVFLSVDVAGSQQLWIEAEKAIVSALSSL